MLDLKKLFDGSVSQVDFSLTVDDCEFVDESVSGSVKASGVITNHSGFVLLEGSLKADLSVSCARCSKDFVFLAEFPLNAKITDKLANEDEDEFVLLEDYALDVDELVRSSLILEMPSRFLCKEDCLGICAKCGTNLNDSKCNCEKSERDPRWDVLKDYFND